MYKWVLLVIFLIFMGGSCIRESGTPIDNINGNSDQKQVLQQYIIETREVMKPYREKDMALSSKGESLKYSGLSENEIKNQMKKLAEERMKLMEKLRQDLRNVNVPNNSPHAKRLAKAWDRYFELREKVADYIAGNSLIAAGAVLLGRDTAIEEEMRELDEEIDRIYDYAGVSRE